MSKTITVYTNAPAPQATVTLTMQGDVWEAFAVEPTMASFGRLTVEGARDPRLAKKLTIVNNLEQPADLTHVRSSSPLFRAETKVIEPGKKFELTVTVVSALGPGSNIGTIELSTGVPDVPTLSIPVNAYVAPDVEVTPSSVVLPANRAAKLQRQVSVRNNTKTPVKISELAVSNPAVQVSLQETQPGMLYTIRIDIPAECTLAWDGERITFKTDCPTAREAVIPITETRVPATRPAPPGQPGAATNKPAAPPGKQASRPSSFDMGDS